MGDGRRRSRYITAAEEAQSQLIALKVATLAKPIHLTHFTYRAQAETDLHKYVSPQQTEEEFDQQCNPHHCLTVT